MKKTIFILSILALSTSGYGQTTKEKSETYPNKKYETPEISHENLIRTFAQNDVAIDSTLIRTFGQEKFEDYPPLRQLQCGLWINRVGDIAYKGMALTDYGVVDIYIKQIHKPPKNEIFDRDNNPADVWKNVVDTATFQKLSPCHFRDKNYHYIFPRVCPVVPIECGRIFFYMNDKTFKKMQKKLEINLQENPCEIRIMEK